MRTLIVLILTLTIPASAYIAGCRQDRTAAAFPKSKELDKLAMASPSDPSRPPEIPPAPIDRSILNLPEQPQRTTMARINAVDDQSRQIAGSRPPAGMFTLPESDTRLAQSSPVTHQAAPAALTPIPSAREFWSKPAPTHGRAVTPVDVPADVSAMMPSQPQPVLAPPSTPQSAASSFMPPPGAKLLPVESVPGVFDAFNTSFRSGGPPERMSESRFPAPGGDALGAPLPSSQAPAGPLQLNLGGMIGPDQPTAARHFQPEPQPLPVVRSIPGAPVYEPLPEPIPLEQYNRMVAPDQRKTAPAALPSLPLATMPPLPEAKPMPAWEEVPAPAMPAPLPLPGANTEPARKSALPFLPLPDFKPAPAKPAPTPMDPPAVTNPRLATLLDSNAVREALAPLPDIAGSGSAAKMIPPPVVAPPQPPAARASSVSLPAPVPEPLPSPELTAAKTALLINPVEPLEDTGKSARDVSSRDLFRMDLPAAPTKSAEAERPSLPTTAVATADEKPAAPQKVKLTPIRSRQRSEELGKIDAATEVPPLRF